MNPVIAAAAEAVASAREAADHANEELAKVKAASARLRERVEAFESERAGIIAARKHGNADDAQQGGRLALIAADLQGLAELRSEADAAVTKATAEAQEANRILVVAEQGLRRATDEDMLARLTEHASKLDVLLLETVQSINATAASLSRHGAVWTPSPELALAIRKLDLMRGNR